MCAPPIFDNFLRPWHSLRIEDRKFNLLVDFADDFVLMALFPLGACGFCWGLAWGSSRLKILPFLSELYQIYNQKRKNVVSLAGSSISVVFFVKFPFFSWKGIEWHNFPTFIYLSQMKYLGFGKWVKVCDSLPMCSFSYIEMILTLILQLTIVGI